MRTTPKERFLLELDKWLNDEPSARQRVAEVVRGGIVNRLPPFRFWGLVNSFVLLALAASGPIVSYHASNLIDLPTALLAFGLLVLLMLVFSGLNRWSRERHKNLSYPMHTLLVRVGDLLETVKSTATAAKEQDSSIESALAIAVSISALVSRVPEKSVGATVVQYVGSSSSKMKVTHRNRGSERPVRRNVKDVETMLGHHACKSGDGPRIVSDLRRFGVLGQNSPTQGSAPYRSIFLYPLVNDQGERRGFISIDCTTPCAFHGSKADNLAALLEPIRAHIQDILY